MDAEDASNVEGVNRIREKEKSRKHSVQAEELQDSNSKSDGPAPSAKTGWGTESSGNVGIESQKAEVEYNFDEGGPDEFKGLEEDESLAIQVAAPPKPSNRLQNIRELATGAISDLPRAKDGSVDLGLLMKVLNARDQIAEADEEWFFESLFATEVQEASVDDDEKAD